jgi:DNA-binding Xre family transcriptional regulator
MYAINFKNLISKEKTSITEISQYTGISRSTLTLLNNGTSKGIQFETLDKICTFLNCKPNDLIKILPDEYTFQTAMLPKESKTNKNYFEYFGELLTVQDEKKLVNSNKMVTAKGKPISIGFWKINPSPFEIIFGIPFYENNETMSIYGSNKNLLKLTSKTLSELDNKATIKLSKDIANFVIKRNPDIFSNKKEVTVGLKSQPKTNGAFNVSVNSFKIDQKTGNLTL